MRDPGTYQVTVTLADGSLEQCAFLFQEPDAGSTGAPVGTVAGGDHLVKEVMLDPILLTELRVVADAHDVGGQRAWTFKQADGTYMVEAVTEPATEYAWSLLTFDPPGSPGDAPNRRRYPRTAVQDDVITVTLPGQPPLHLTVNILSAEIEVNDTPEAADDLVQLRCHNPNHDHRTHCRVRLLGNPPEDIPVLMTNPDGRLRFPTAVDQTVGVTLPADRSWAAFPITGHTGSAAIGDAQIEAKYPDAGGETVATQPATVFWFDNADLTITPVGSYQIVGETFMAVPTPGVEYRMEARIRPASVDCSQPQIIHLGIGLAQNQTRQYRTMTWDTPQVRWNGAESPGSEITVPGSVRFIEDLPDPMNDSAQGYDPLYDNPAMPDTYSPDSVRPPIGCAGGGVATTHDSPFQSFPRVWILGLFRDQHGHEVAVVDYANFVGVTMDLQFRSWTVLFDKSTSEVCPLVQRAWSLTVDSTAGGVQQAVVGATTWPPAMPISGGPYSNESALDARYHKVVRQGAAFTIFTAS
jgi:hypothetical protein